jgi:hypothetical protein
LDTRGGGREVVAVGDETTLPCTWTREEEEAVAVMGDNPLALGRESRRRRGRWQLWVMKQLLPCSWMREEEGEGWLWSWPLKWPFHSHLNTRGGGGEVVIVGDEMAPPLTLGYERRRRSLWVMKQPSLTLGHERRSSSSWATIHSHLDMRAGGGGEVAGPGLRNGPSPCTWMREEEEGRWLVLATKQPLPSHLDVKGGGGGSLSWLIKWMQEVVVVGVKNPCFAVMSC